TEIGQTAEALSQQPELANEPIREAAELAAALTPQVPSEASSQQDASQAESQGDSPTDFQPASSASPTAQAETQPGEPQPSATPPGQTPAGMTPRDPMSSAQLLSGTEASAMATEMLAQMKTEDGTGSLLPGEPATNKPKPQLPESTHDLNVRTSASTGRRPWTTSLPDEIRNSMRSSSKQELPKYYENQLKAYFQTFDQ
ncbi:MAG TPA: hypothetical protein VE890_00450, partial [Thermoguttaceae bacterium]|nr:hypothetical protein [Thermoguttaceae bacterium]